MFEFGVGLLIGALLVALFLAVVRLRGADRLGPTLVPARQRALDLRPPAAETNDSERDVAFEVWWEAQPIMSIERLDQRELPAREPVPGALATLVAHLLDDAEIHKLLDGDRYAVVRVPGHLRGSSWVQTVGGGRLPVLRDSSGRISGIAPIIGGAGAGAAVASAPALAGAVAAAWAHQQLESTMSAMRAGMERIELRLDDVDHGVIAAAHGQLARLVGLPSSWSALDLAELAAHRAALERVYETARRRAGRRLSTLTAGEEFPLLTEAEVREAQRDLVLLVDATLARGQLEIVRSVSRLGAGDGRAGLTALARVEDELRTELDGLTTQLGDVLERAEPGWHRVSSRRKVTRSKSELGQTVAALEQLRSDLGEQRDAELVITEREGMIEVSAVDEEPPKRPEFSPGE